MSAAVKMSPIKVAGDRVRDMMVRELGIAMPVMAQYFPDDTVPCACCEATIPYPEASICVTFDHDGYFIFSWMCSACWPEARASKGANLRICRRVSEADASQFLIQAAGTLDSELLKRTKGEPFIRRPTYLESQRSGHTLARETAILIKQEGGAHLRRRVLPMPFPWRDFDEWWVVGGTVQETIDVADAVERGEAIALASPWEQS